MTPMAENKKTVLTGITTTGSPHLGNYVGAIKPAIEASHRSDTNSCYFLADYHALIKCPDPEKIRQLNPGNCGDMAGIGAGP